MSDHQSNHKPYVTIDDCTIVAETAKAIKVRIPVDVRHGIASSYKEHWLPKSQLHVDSITDEGDEGTVVIPEWLAEDHDLPWVDYY